MRERNLRGGSCEMCQACNTKPVYEFTNKRKLCRRCFINWFQKKFLYTIRKFGMIKKGDVVGYHKKNDFREVVLEYVLKMFENKLMIAVVKISDKKRANIKIALSETINSTSDKIVHQLIKGDVKNLKETSPIQKNIIKPLYLFTDEEVLLYAKLKKLKFRELKTKKDNISEFVDELEKKHPEVKRAVVKGVLGLK